MLNTRKRRLVSIALILLGALLMFVIHDIWLGAILFAAGMVLDIVGLLMNHFTPDK
ncbi:MAG: hypothetical protein ABFS02_05520 [Pseudomonadota bacterium]